MAQGLAKTVYKRSNVIPKVSGTLINVPMPTKLLNKPRLEIQVEPNSPLYNLRTSDHIDTEEETKEGTLIGNIKDCIPKMHPPSTTRLNNNISDVNTESSERIHFVTTSGVESILIPQTTKDCNKAKEVSQSISFKTRRRST